MNDDLTPGWRTTEFYVTLGGKIGALVIALVALLGGKPEDGQALGTSANNAVVGIGALVAFVVLGVYYVRSRTSLKAAAMKMLVLVAVLVAALPAIAADAPTPTPPGYDAVAAASERTHLPVVVWVGMKPRPIGGAYGLACLEFPDAAAPCVVVGTWERGKFNRYDLPAAATDAEIIVRANAEVRAPARAADVPCPT